MIGIEAIGTYIPSGRRCNAARLEEFGVTEESLVSRIGFRQLARKADDQTTLSLASAAFRELVTKTGLDVRSLDSVVVVTQNPDRNIPHMSAELHGHMGLPESCACFDIALGCSGYVYALSIMSAFLTANRMSRGVVITADPYSSIVDRRDKDTSLIFGDAATATLLSDAALYAAGSYTFGTMGVEAPNLTCRDGRLSMNGRAVFNFAATRVPADVLRVLRANDMSIEQVDRFIFHQGSRYVVETIANRLAISHEKARFYATEYGNTVSSSIPLILAGEMQDAANRSIVLCGFGAGFSWASTILRRRTGDANAC